MVSGNHKAKPEEWVPVKMAVVRYEEWNKVSCNCGWTYTHRRERVRENAIDRHFQKRHEGRGIRL